jgi:hypothetical protein
MDTKVKIQQAYQAFIKNKCKKPESFDAFSEHLKSMDIELKDVYHSLTRIERDIVLGTFTETLSRLENEPEYLEFSTREKVLACYFTWLEELVEIREMLKVLTKHSLVSPVTERFLKSVEPVFKTYIEDLLIEGADTGEIADRKIIESRYPFILWYNTRFILQYWLNDDSEDYERTDAAIEKAVNFVFDLLAPNLIDSGFDLLKFLVGK